MRRYLLNFFILLIMSITSQISKAEGFLLASDVSCRLWWTGTTCKVMQGAAANINLKSSSWETSVPVELEVWNFALPDVPNMHSAFGLYSGMFKQYHNLKTTEELKQVLDLYYQIFREYRISPQQFFDMYPISKNVKGVWWNGGTFDPDTVFSGKYSYQVTDGNSAGNVAGTPSELIKITSGKPYWLKWQLFPVLPDNRDPNNDKTRYLAGPVPSLRLEIMREGIDDYDYMMLREDCIRRARTDPHNLVKKAKQVLNFGAEVFETEKEYTKNPEILTKYRHK
jgi:hypothetical protein